MIQAFKEFFASLSGTGKTTVAVVLILAISGLLALAMWLGYRMDWLPPFLTQLAGG